MLPKRLGCHATNMHTMLATTWSSFPPRAGPFLLSSTHCHLLSLATVALSATLSHSFVHKKKIIIINTSAAEMHLTASSYRRMSMACPSMNLLVLAAPRAPDHAHRRASRGRVAAVMQDASSSPVVHAPRTVGSGPSEEKTRTAADQAAQNREVRVNLQIPLRRAWARWKTKWRCKRGKQMQNVMLLVEGALMRRTHAEPMPDIYIIYRHICMSACNC